MRRLLVLVAGVAVLGAAAVAGAATTTDGDDTPVLLDLRSVAVTSAPAKRLDATFTTYEAWGVPLLSGAKSGPPGTLCMLIWTKHAITAAADYLVCAAPNAAATKLVGSVMRESAKGALPRKVATATVTRPNTRSVRLRFSLASIGSPVTLRYAGEATQFAGCPPETGCIDRAPNRRAAGTFTLAG
jgi:hypothetical protein